MKWKLAFRVVILTILLLEFGLCQKKGQDASDKKPKVKPKKTKTVTPKPKVRGTPAPPSQVTLTQVLDKGKFLKVGDTLSVPAGGSLELRCKGKPVQWAVPYYLQEEDEGRLRTVQHARYGALILSNATGADTGEYTCYPMHCEEKDCRKDYERAVKVFVFFPESQSCVSRHMNPMQETERALPLSFLDCPLVPVTDPQELFVPSSDYYEMIQLRTNRPTVLPCQVTNPQATVTLHREFPPEELKVDGTEISFDLKRGFTIHRPRPHHAGSLYCVASHGMLRQSSVKYVLIYVNYPTSPPSPVIQASSTSVRVGENLQIICSVMGEANVAIEFTWDYPGQEIGRPLYTEDSVRPMRGSGQGQQRSETVLLVDEVREVDGGTYTCTAQNMEGSRSASTSVKVLPAQTATPRPRRP